MTFRTDLALEKRELQGSGALDGVREKQYSEGALKVTEIEILKKQAAKRLERPCGRYLTAELPGGMGEENAV